jgi:hypothetical protein
VPSADATVACSLVSCSHGKVGQPCQIAGYPGIVVQAAPTELACDPSPASSFPEGSGPPASVPVPPSPVSTAATLNSSCQVGDAVPDSNGDPSAYHPGVPVPGTDAAWAYVVTLTNDSQVTAEVAGFAVVFYNGSGAEVGSDTHGVTQTFITPGQSLNWTQWTPQASGSSSEGSTAAATCQLIQWYS